jgi:hypothetical protein
MEDFQEGGWGYEGTRSQKSGMRDKENIPLADDGRVVRDALIVGVGALRLFEGLFGLQCEEQW